MNQNDSRKKTEEVEKQGNKISLRAITNADEYLGHWSAASEDLLEPE